MDRILNLLEQSVRLQNDIAEMKRNLYKVTNIDDVPVSIARWRAACQSASVRLVSEQRYRKEQPQYPFTDSSHLSLAPNDVEHRQRLVDMSTGTDLRPRGCCRDRRRSPKIHCRGHLADENKENAGFIIAAAAPAARIHRKNDTLLGLQNTASPAAAVMRCQATVINRCPPLTHVLPSRGDVAVGHGDGKPTLLPPSGKRPTHYEKRTLKPIMSVETYEYLKTPIGLKMMSSRRDSSASQCIPNEISLSAAIRSSAAAAVSYSTCRVDDDTSVWSGTGSKIASALTSNDRQESMAEIAAIDSSNYVDPDLSRIVPGSPDHLRRREQTSSGDLTGAFHSTFVYPLHSTMVSTVSEELSTFDDEEAADQPHRHRETASSLSSLSYQLSRSDDDDDNDNDLTSSTQIKQPVDETAVARSKTTPTKKARAGDIFIDVGVHYPADTSPVGDVITNVRDRDHDITSDDWQRPNGTFPVHAKFYFPPLTATTPLFVVKETAAASWRQQQVPSFSAAEAGRFGEDSSSSSGSSSRVRLFMKRQLAQSRFENDDEITVDVESMSESHAQIAGPVSPFPPSATATATAVPDSSSTRAVEGSTLYVVDRWSSMAVTSGCACRHRPCRTPRGVVVGDRDRSRKSAERLRVRQVVPVGTEVRDTVVRTDRKCNAVSARCHRHRQHRAVAKHRQTLPSVPPVSSPQSSRYVGRARECYTLLPPSESNGNGAAVEAAIARYRRRNRKRALAQRFKLLSGCFCDGQNKMQLRTLAFL